MPATGGLSPYTLTCLLAGYVFTASCPLWHPSCTGAAPRVLQGEAATPAPGCSDCSRRCFAASAMLLHHSRCLNAVEGDHKQISAQMLALSPFTPCCSEELPPPPRRDRLPKPQQVEKSVGLWSIIKECVGKDLTRVCLPVFFNEPLSALQKSAEDLEYAELLDKVRLPAVRSSGGKLARDWWAIMGKEATRYCAAPGACSSWLDMMGAGGYLATT